jgi:hypothetical protein
MCRWPAAAAVSMGFFFFFFFFFVFYILESVFQSKTMHALPTALAVGLRAIWARTLYMVLLYWSSRDADILLLISFVNR